MNKITSLNSDWKVKFEFLIDRLGALISQEGKKLVLVNVEAGKNPKKQFVKYMESVELVRDRVECVVSTSLLGEERIFWPFYDVQFYIKNDKDPISATGNPEIIQRVFNVDDREVATTLPGMDYWKGKKS